MGVADEFYRSSLTGRVLFIPSGAVLPLGAVLSLGAYLSFGAVG